MEHAWKACKHDKCFVGSNPTSSVEEVGFEPKGSPVAKRQEDRFSDQPEGPEALAGVYPTSSVEEVGFEPKGRLSQSDRRIALAISPKGRRRSRSLSHLFR